MKTVEFEFDVGDSVIVCLGETMRIKAVVDGLLLDASGAKRYSVKYADKMGKLTTDWAIEGDLVADA